MQLVHLSTLRQYTTFSGQSPSSALHRETALKWWPCCAATVCDLFVALSTRLEHRTSLAAAREGVLVILGETSPCVSSEGDVSKSESVSPNQRASMSWCFHPFFLVVVLLGDAITQVHLTSSSAQICTQSSLAYLYLKLLSSTVNRDTALTLVIVLFELFCFIQRNNLPGVSTYTYWYLWT